MVDTSAHVEENKMSRDLNNIRRLFAKLQLRYGDDDELVMQLKKELDAREALNQDRKQWSVPYREFIKLVASRPAATQAGPRTSVHQ
ncbi:MAG: hypothetical protein D4R79_13520 [Comamonadaceae bacterium]|nr:MAG: hypothetical protein D4R79_13520 [Comamonadaceae bacterium]